MAPHKGSFLGRCDYDLSLFNKQNFLNFSSDEEFLLCLKDNFRDYAISRFHQVCEIYYTRVSYLNQFKFINVNDIKESLQCLLDEHTYLNTIMRMINEMLKIIHPNHLNLYKVFITTNSMSERIAFLCIHLNTFIDIPEKIFFHGETGYLNLLKIGQCNYNNRHEKIMQCSFCRRQMYYNEDMSNVGDCKIIYYN